MSLYILFVCLPQIILHASMYYMNSSPWSYTPPHNSLSTKPHYIIWRCITSDHFLISTNYIAITTPHFHTFPLRLPTSPPVCNTSSFRTHEPIPEYHPNLSLVTWVVTDWEVFVTGVAARWLVVRPSMMCSKAPNCDSRPLFCDERFSP